MMNLLTPDRFLLAELYLDSLQGKDTPKAIRTALTRMIPGTQTDNAYTSAYEEEMKRIKCQVSERVRRAKQILAWITCAKRQLRTVELQQALAVEPNTRALDESNVTRIEDLVSICAGLVTTDKESGTIRLQHYTTQDHFEFTREKWFPGFDKKITVTCATYLSYEEFITGYCTTDKEFEKHFEEHCFYDYAVRNWCFHAREFRTEEVLQFLKTDGQVQASAQRLVAGGARYKFQGYTLAVSRIPSTVTFIPADI